MILTFLWLQALVAFVTEHDALFSFPEYVSHSSCTCMFAISDDLLVKITHVDPHLSWLHTHHPLILFGLRVKIWTPLHLYRMNVNSEVGKFLAVLKCQCFEFSLPPFWHANSAHTCLPSFMIKLGKQFPASLLIWHPNIFPLPKSGSGSLP